MNTQQTINTEAPDRRPHLGRLYLRGMATYTYFRLLDAIHAVINLLLAPPRWVLHRLEDGWFRLKTWLARNRRRLIWSIVALVFLSVLAGGAVTLYLWREPLLDIAQELRSNLAHITNKLRRKAVPVIVVATGTPEEMPAVPNPDGVIK
jgi:hypothetical protein